MKVMMWTDVEKMEIRELDVPAVGEHEVLLKVEVVGICGSEIEGYLGHNTLRVPPIVMGHEFSGIVESFGSGVTGLQKGQRATVNPLTWCGECDRCRNDLVMHCKQRKLVGVNTSGGFAEWVVVPKSTVIVVPDELDPFRAALSEPLACSVRAARRAMDGHAFANVLVFGAGGIGLLCGKMAKVLGAASIMIADTNDERLEIAGNVGFDYTVNPKSASLQDEIKARFGDKGVDVVIDAAGFQATREAAMRVLNPGGTLMNIGLGIDDTVVPLNHQVRSEIRMLGSFCYSPQDFKDAVDLLSHGKITEEGWTEIRTLEEGPQAFRDLVAGKVKSGKIFLKV